MAGRLQDYLEDEFNGNYSGSKFQGDAISAAGLQAKMELEKERNKSSRTSDRDKSAIGRAIAGVMGLAEFQERDYDDERWEDEPEKFNPKLVDKKTGQEVKLTFMPAKSNNGYTALVNIAASTKYDINHENGKIKNGLQTMKTVDKKDTSFEKLKFIRDL